MPLYDYRCQNQECGHVFEAVNSQDDRSAAQKCPECSVEAYRIVSFRNSKPTFTEKLYPFYHQGIGRVVTSEADLNRQCAELGFYSKHDGAYMTPRHERRLLDKRLHEGPREVVEKVRWSGRGANLPVFETYDPETGDSGESESSSEASE